LTVRRTKEIAREPLRFSPGCSTAHGREPEFRVRKLRRFGVTGTWLDLGCSDGYYGAALLAAGADGVKGIDLDEGDIARARELWADEPRLEFTVANAERLPFADGEFDAVLMNEVLEHLPDEQAALAEARRVLADGGLFVLFGPNRWFPFEGHGAQIGRHTFGFPVPLLPWLPSAITSRWMIARNYWPRELKATVAAAGFHVVAVDFAFPLLSTVGRLPERWRARYEAAVPTLERLPGIRRFGVSAMIAARR